MRLFSASMLLLPLLLIFGVVVQSGALYLFGIILPAVALLGGFGPLRQRFPTLGVGLALLALYIVFPLANFWNLPRFAASAPGFSGVTSEFVKSQVTSGVFFSGLALVGLSWFRLNPRRGVLSGGTPVSPEDVGIAGLRWFVVGLLAGSVILTVFVAVEHRTGVAWRPFSHHPEPHLDGGGTFRPFGFYGGPLHLAGASLAWVSVAWFLFWRWFEAKVCGLGETRWCLRVFSRQWLFPVMLLTIVILQTTMVVMVAGRTAALVNFGVLAVLPLFVRLRRNRGIVRLVFGAAMAGCGALAMACTPLGRRFFDMMHETLDPTTSSAAQHMVNWQVHWELFKNNPLFGNGSYWLDLFARKQQYELMGYPESLVPHNNSHNIFLEALASVGLVGVFAIAGAIIVGLMLLIRVSRRHPLARSLVAALLVAAAANVAHGFTENTFYSSNVAYVYLGILWTFVWVTVCLSSGNSSSQAAPVPVPMSFQSESSPEQISRVASA